MDAVFSIIIKFSLTFIFSLLFGLERQKSHKPIGFGTYIFVSTGACGLAITAILINTENPLPLLGAVITGIGFLGAGALIKTTDKIFGFTSATCIWIFSILGLIIGVGEYLIAVILYILVWLVIVIDKFLEIKGIGSYQKKIIIKANKNINNNDIWSALNIKKYKIVNMDYNKKNNIFSFIILVEGQKNMLNRIPRNLIQKEWIESFVIE